VTLARRRFLQFAASSPLLAQGFAQAPASPKTAAAALGVMDFEPLAHAALPPGHWGYLSAGVEDDKTVRANREGFEHYQLRPRRLVDASTTDLKTEVFGATWEHPFYLSAVGSQGAFHAEGELPVARAAKAKKTAQMLSTMTSYSVEEVAKNLGTAPWYQLYMPTNWPDTEKMVKRAEAAGCPVLAWTVDLLTGRNAETSTRLALSDTRDCLSCHVAHPITGVVAQRNRSRPMFAGLSGEMNPPQANWSYVDRLKKMSSMKLLIKGIDTPEDALLAREHGADGIVVSNHGGRATETGLATIDVLPEIIDAVGRQFPVFVDGGFRRGSDIYKALAIGAKAVGIGRPYIYGLTAFGQPGVERVIDILRAELTLTMRQSGTPKLSQISRASILRQGARL
jgi:4-hydroxymandelate oxidase